ncbi:MAG TPA: hypothetical protein VGP80_00340 [Gemmatimonadales bacterium]|nr:hypothetical protein [Gemmatimonadales bacterium]
MAFRGFVAGSITSACMVLAHPSLAAAQDPFEVEVYPYETAAPGEWELETHFNYAARGTRERDETVAASDNQVHLTAEITRGLTSNWELAGYVMTAYRPGAGFELAGGRARTRVHVPKRAGLPVDLGVNVEFSVMRPSYNHSSAVIEFAPTLEKRFGRIQLDLNASFGRDLNGPEADAGWEFEPSGRIGVDVSERITLVMEYFGGLGHLWGLSPARDQVHQFYPGVELRLGDDITWNMGVGIGATSVGNTLVFKSQFEVPLREL